MVESLAIFTQGWIHNYLGAADNSFSSRKSFEYNGLHDFCCRCDEGGISSIGYNYGERDVELVLFAGFAYC